MNPIAILILNVDEFSLWHDFHKMHLQSVLKLVEILEQVRNISEIDKNRIINCLSENNLHDRYEEFFNLLHGREHKWVEELEQGMKYRQQSIKLHSGQGYLIHDRRWLHGRDHPSRAITEKRLHRLVFNTRQTLSWK